MTGALHYQGKSISLIPATTGSSDSPEQKSKMQQIGVKVPSLEDNLFKKNKAEIYP